LITRSDFDGLACAMILKELDMLEDIMFVHPKDMQDGMIDVSDMDITTNVPYQPGVHLAFDHHISEADNKYKNYINLPDAPSTARVVYNYFGGAGKLKHITKELMDAVDKADNAQYTLDDITDPHGWILLSYIMDARTGLGRFKNFRVSNYDLMMKLIDFCSDHTIDEILQHPDVKERVDLYFEQKDLFAAQIKKVHEIVGDVVVLHLKNEDPVFAGNRFYVYAMYPQAKISVHEMWGLKKRNTVFAVGKSIVDRSSDVNIGDICHTYGGGGHKNAGTCQVPNSIAGTILEELLVKLNKK